MKSVFKITIALLFILIMAVPSSAWWNASWAARTDNAVDNGPRPYQLRLILSNATGTNNATHVFCNGLCSPNFTDIRFTLQETTPLSYWIENASTGLVWVNLTANGTVNMYYGESAVSTTSNGDTTFILFDDFPGSSLNTTKWDSYNYYDGSLNVSSGVLSITKKMWVSSKSKYTPTLDGIGYFMRTRAKRGPVASPASGYFGIGFESGKTYGAETLQSNPFYYYQPTLNFSCMVGKDNQVYANQKYTTVHDANYHIAEIRRGGTNETCRFDDSQTIYASFPSTISRYLAIDSWTVNVDVDYIFMGNYLLTGAPAWKTWGAQVTSAPNFIPPTPVLVSQINNTYHNVSWQAGVGNKTDMYRICDNSVCRNTTDTYTNYSLTPHAWHYLTVNALNTSNYTLSPSALSIDYQRPNAVPVFNLGDKAVYVNEMMSLQLESSDGDGDTITYSTNAPLYDSFDTASGVFIWTPTAWHIGTYSVYFSASDGYDTTTQNIIIQVLNNRTISIFLYNIGYQNVYINTSQTFSSLGTLFLPRYISVWNSSTQAWEKYKYGWSYRQNQIISHDVAASVKVATNSTKTIYVHQGFGWLLNVGQNLIGVPHNMTLSEINASVNIGVGCDNVDEITYIIPTTMQDKTYTCIAGIGQANASTIVETGYGVWMNAVQAVDIRNVGGYVAPYESLWINDWAFSLENGAYITVMNTTFNNITCCDSNKLLMNVSHHALSFNASTNKTITYPTHSSDNFTMNISGTAGYLNFTARMDNISTSYTLYDDGAFVESRSSGTNKVVWFNFTGALPSFLSVINT